LKARPINGTFGVQVEDVRLPDLTDAQFAELHGHWRAHGAMLVRGQESMTDAQFEVFSKRFGELDPPPNQGRRPARTFPTSRTSMWCRTRWTSPAIRLARSATARRSGTPT